MAGPDDVAPAGDVVASCRALRVTYAAAAGTVDALRGVDAAVERGRLTVIAGPSGSGKSTLLRALAGLEPVRSGEVVVGGRTLTALRPGARRRLRRREIGVVLQAPAENLVSYLTALEQVVLAARLRGTDPGEARAALAAVGGADLADRRPAQLSGGEQQRVAVAAGVVGRPMLVVADEPTAALDAAAADRLIGVLRSLADHGTTLVASSHDDALVEAADRVIRLRDGEVVAR